ncbi:GLUG motif-containing protein [Cloacibacillus porcorum]
MQETTRKRHNQTKIASPQASNHRLLYLIATLLFILAAALAAPMTARAAETEPASKDNVYQIGTADELIWFRDAVNAGSADISAKLTKDIVLSGEWEPIGKYTDKTPNGYTGTFNGGGFTVSGYSVNVPVKVTWSDSAGAGFFGLIGERSEIRNLTTGGAVNVTSGDGKYSYYAGGLAARNEKGRIINCKNSGTVTNNVTSAENNCAGGIVGANTAGELINCENGGNVTVAGISSNANNAGGVAGQNFGESASVKGIVINCSNNASVTITGASDNVNHAGGISGNNFYMGLVSDCQNSGPVNCSGARSNDAGGIAGNTNNGEVLNSKNTVAVTASGQAGSGNWAGGITGGTQSDAKISNCENSGDVTADGSPISNNAGGIAGSTGYDKVIITYCINKGTVTGKNGSFQIYVGGIVGCLNRDSSISDCASTGAVSSQNGGSICHTGGIAGASYNNSKVKNCGWDKNSSGAAKSIGDGDTTGTYDISNQNDVVTTLAAVLDKNILKIGEQGTITLKTLLDNTGFAAHVTNVKAAASDNSVLKVEETTGSAVAFTAAGRGESTVTVTAALTPTDFSGGKASAKNVTFSFYIEVRDDAPKPISVENVTLASRDLTLNVGESAQLTATVTPDNATDKSVKWSSSAPEVVSADQSGKITALKAGKATVTVTTNNGGKTASCAVTVNSPAKPQPKQPDVDNSVEISKDIDISETPAVYDNVEAAAKDISSDIKAEELEVSDGSVSLKDARTEEIVKANLEDGAALESVITLPLFSVRTEKEKTAISAWVVKGSDLLSDTIEKVDARKIVSTTELLKFQYKASGFTDGSFTVLGMDGKLATGAVDKDKRYQLLLFIADGGKYDLNDAAGVITDPAAIVKTGGTPTPKPSGGSSSGCSAGFGALALLALVPLAMKKKR